MRRSFFQLCPVLVALTLPILGCAGNHYAYTPTTTTSATIGDVRAADYGFPPETPRGDVRIATIGLASKDASTRAIHVRMIVNNEGVEPWTVNVAEQRADIDDKGKHSIALASTAFEPKNPTSVTIAPHTSSSIELYFPLPERREDAGDIPAFEAIWTVHLNRRSITTRTEFTRYLIPAAPIQENPSVLDPFNTEPSDPKAPRGPAEPF